MKTKDYGQVNTEEVLNLLFTVSPNGGCSLPCKGLRTSIDTLTSIASRMAVIF